MEETEPTQNQTGSSLAAMGRFLARHVWWGVLLCVGVVAMGLFARQWYGVKVYYVASRSMSPSLQLEDRILVDQIAYRSDAPERNDVVLFKRTAGSDTTSISRVIGLPSETIEIRQKKVYIDGRKLDEPHAHFQGLPNLSDYSKTRDALPPKRVPAGQYFLLGDNRDDSFDSRFCGPIPRERILGAVRTVLQSSDETGISWEPITP
jgi:signal peptidase I